MADLPAKVWITVVSRLESGKVSIVPNGLFSVLFEVPEQFFDSTRFEFVFKIQGQEHPDSFEV